MKKELKNQVTGKVYEITRETKTQYICELDGRVIIRCRKGANDKDGDRIYYVGGDSWERPMILIAKEV